MQLMAFALDGEVAPAGQREYGFAQVEVRGDAPLLHGLPASMKVWMSHGDQVVRAPDGFEALGSSDNSPTAIMGDASRGYYAVQFHPEVVHTPKGADLLANFVLRVCDCRGDWTPAHFVDSSVQALRSEVQDGRVLVAVSGGVDSSVMAALVHRAVGDRVLGLFIDHGLLRANEAEEVQSLFSALHIPIRMVDACDVFLTALEGVEDPEDKRRIIGNTFVRVFEQEVAAESAEYQYLAQGTLYPDVIESATPATKAAHKIKTHHNVGGLPEDHQFRVLEPLRYLFKDEVRAVGRELGLPESVVRRPPFPGPGLAVRILGPVTPQALERLRAADAIVRTEIESAEAELGDEFPWQYFAVLTPLQSVGVMGDQRTYANLVGVRAVTSLDGMTADWARLPEPLLSRISTRIVNEVPGVNRVVYDITSKPPATIEWE
jgi:GMP synthase (glutamine-hydrolysing)